MFWGEFIFFVFFPESFLYSDVPVKLREHHKQKSYRIFLFREVLIFLLLFSGSFSEFSRKVFQIFYLVLKIFFLFLHKNLGRIFKN
jgi:hypothetical protein